MALVVCAGADVLSGRISLRLRGAWSAELVLDTDTRPTGKVELEAEGGLELTGTVVGGGPGLTGATTVRLVGGAGGLAKQVSGAFRSAQLRDPLDAALRAGGESLSSTVATSILGIQLARWSQGKHHVGRELDDLAAAATKALGSTVNWRFLGDGAVWLGVETWPAATLPDGAEVLDALPAEGRYVIGVDTPALLPGVDLAGVGKVQAVDHVLDSTAVRTHAWT